MGSPLDWDKTEKGIEGPHLEKTKRRIKKITTIAMELPWVFGSMVYFTSHPVTFQPYSLLDSYI
jgi:hypothetical protein